MHNGGQYQFCAILTVVLFYFSKLALTMVHGIRLRDRPLKLHPAADLWPSPPQPHPPDPPSANSKQRALAQLRPDGRRPPTPSGSTLCRPRMLHRAEPLVMPLAIAARRHRSPPPLTVRRSPFAACHRIPRVSPQAPSLASSLPQRRASS